MKMFAPETCNNIRIYKQYKRTLFVPRPQNALPNHRFQEHYIDVCSIYVSDVVAAGVGYPASRTKTRDTPIAGHRNLFVHHNTDENQCPR